MKILKVIMGFLAVFGLSYVFIFFIKSLVGFIELKKVNKNYIDESFIEEIKKDTEEMKKNSEELKLNYLKFDGKG